MYLYLLSKHITAIVYIIDVINIAIMLGISTFGIMYTTEVTKRLNNIKN